MLSNNKIGRREFLKKAAGTAVGAISFPYIVSSRALGKNGAAAASERIVVGCIGTGPQGCGVMGGFLSQADAEVVAVCDVKQDRLEFAKNTVEEKYQRKGCATYDDFREVVGRNDIDAVLIATPDHWHVPVAMAAARAGKDMYVEKPLGMSIHEGQTLRRALKKYGRIFQFGTQQRSQSMFRLAYELVKNGRIGKLHTINVWSPASVAGGPDEPAPVPEGINYDMWIGPAPFTPYTKYRCSDDGGKKTWWFHSDFSHGFLAGWGIHPMDIALWGAEDQLGRFIEIEGTGTFPTTGACDTATDWDVRLRYDNGVIMNFLGLEILSNDGLGLSVSPRFKHYGKAWSHGTAFEGSEGWVHVSRFGINTSPEGLVRTKFAPDEIQLGISKGHVRNFLDSVRTRTKAISDIEPSVQSDIVCQISNLCMKLGRKVIWDSEKECFVNDEAANRLLRRAKRGPWHL